MPTEYAILVNGSIVNVVTGTYDGAFRIAQEYIEQSAYDTNVDVKPLDQVPLAVKQKYRYWNERP